MAEKPAEVFARDVEWRDLSDFVESPAPGLRIGVVYGRRRQGKSFLLRRLARAASGLYTMAVEQEAQPALRRFADAVARVEGRSPGTFTPGGWETALDDALRRHRLVVIDEYPFLLKNAPELSSLVQSVYDEWDFRADGSSARLLLSGSAISVMSELLSGSHPLRGRAVLDMCLQAFNFREAAAFWQAADPEIAFHLHAIFGGTPGYRALIDPPVPGRVADLGPWLARTVLNPSHALFEENDYLLREDPRITDRALYHSILAAIASGAGTPSQIGRQIGRPDRALSHPLSVLRAAGFVRPVQDVLKQRGAQLVLMDPIVRFYNTIMWRRLADLEERRGVEVWAGSSDTFLTQALGPHFEDLAREWTSRFAARECLGEPVGAVGRTVVSDPAGRAQHELDVVALAAGEPLFAKNARVILLGEAKYTSQPRTVADLRRLEHVRALLTGRGVRAGDAALAIFARTGFDADLRREASGRRDVHLVTLADLYGAGAF
ncbi:ATPase [Sphaerisporangium melleum]|uniref:ATPase n=2 Tax=Sphaerisporangium melleum TaxID=321316 RepID=A0A917VDW8_9ACTN|nr:ATP-binding protein [Sphaerisporangium melleum]GGK68370.1 ATPase [Sphaerisporangium melleum]GII68875.1 ATPase [Sphaerisporangium melleum]